MNDKEGMSAAEFLVRQRLLADEAKSEARFTKKQKLENVSKQMEDLKAEMRTLEDELSRIPAYKRLLELKEKHAVLWKERARLRTHKSPLLLELKSNNHYNEIEEKIDQDYNVE